MTQLLDRLRARVRPANDYSQDELLNALLEDAADMIRGYCARETVPDECRSAQVRLAVALYNRRGMEGESSHSEGGVSYVVDAMPEDVKHMLRPYRLARTVKNG